MDVPLWLQYSTTTTKNPPTMPQNGGGGDFLWLVAVGGGGWSRHHSTIALVECGWSDVYSTLLHWKIVGVECAESEF